MALQTSGPISISNIKAELGSASNSLRALSSAAGFSTPDAMSEFYGYSSFNPAWVAVHSIATEAGSSVSGQGIASNPWVIGTNLRYYGVSPYGGDYWFGGNFTLKVFTTYLGPINFHLKLVAHSPTLVNGGEPQEIVYTLGNSTTEFQPRQLISGPAGSIISTPNSSFPYPIGTEFVSLYGENTLNQVNYFSILAEEYYAGGAPVVPRWTWNVWFTPA